MSSYDDDTKQIIRQQTIEVVKNQLHRSKIEPGSSEDLFEHHNATDIDGLAGSIADEIINLLSHKFVDRHMPVVRHRLSDVFMGESDPYQNNTTFDTFLNLRQRIFSAGYPLGDVEVEDPPYE